MHVTDWLPTFLSLAGANSSDILPNIDGIDQWQSLKQNSAPSPRSELLYNIDPHPPGKINKVKCQQGHWARGVPRYNSNFVLPGNRTIAKSY